MVLDRWHARRAAKARPATGITSQPEPRTIGHFARGRQLLAGNFLFAGSLIEAPDTAPWALTAPDVAFSRALHGFGWMDDLAAVGDARARQTAQGWLQGWIAQFGGGKGPGWTPDLTGRRMIRWIGHALFLLRGQDKEASDAFYRSLAQQTIFLSHRWESAAPGLPRFEALTGMIYAALSLTGMEEHLSPALTALERDCRTQIDDEGGLPTRNPEELLEVFTLLTWAALILRENGHQPGAELTGALQRVAPTLRALRHADGGLARFHGGGRGLEGRLDHALADAEDRSRPEPGLHMGFTRLQAGRSTVVMDCAPPPTGDAARSAHASTLAFELTSGRRPVVVNCGSGMDFGIEWRRAGRATPSHSTLSLGGLSSAQLANTDRNGDELLIDGPQETPWDSARTPEAFRIEAGHDGWRHSHGLTHARTLDLHFDGRVLVGEDILTTLSPEDEEGFDQMLDRRNLDGVPFAIRFHLHPDADASLDLGGNAVSISLRSGEIWVFRCDGPAAMSLENSVYLESGRLRPRATQQVVLSGVVLSYATRVRWAFAKAHDTPTALRDVALPEDEGTADPA
ncbi:MAG: heparinase [Rhodobacterales bacterium]|nr:MAG: heparinase [Rhodobacterales bacterium]